MDHNPLVSVIIPTKNSVQTLETCLRSIKGQTYEKIETIVVDNYSTDDTAKIGERYGRVLSMGFERSQQRNFGAKKANGEYFLFIDSDMELMPSVVEECVNIALKEGCDAIIIPEISVGEGFWAKCIELEKKSYIGYEPIEAARCFKKDVFWKCGAYNEQLAGGGEDWDLHLKVKKTGYKISRVNALIKHHYGRHGLVYSLRKKYRYAKTIGNYIWQHPDYASKQFSPLRVSFMRDKEAIAADPVHTLGLILMKTFEFFLGAVGMIDNNWSYVLLLKLAHRIKRIRIGK